MTVLLLVVGAAVGAPSRYLIDRFVQSRHSSVFPWGTLGVNILGSLILGGLAGANAGLDPQLAMLIGTGFCGALSTFSTFGFETLQLTRSGAHRQAVANVVVTLLAGLGAASLGWTIGQALV
ncbi:fluoride efflux transporter CrcB [Nakamurella lactea]|uniref:fluoride efflux transporter CrcB n=1 Tax=Nakamurella lactea TaxID=459515 RepID=UPI000410E76A|nr:fluoride efflux transporter CrcB [Nakamurella lactea]